MYDPKKLGMCLVYDIYTDIELLIPCDLFHNKPSLPFFVIFLLFIIVAFFLFVYFCSKNQKRFSTPIKNVL